MFIQVYMTDTSPITATGRLQRVPKLLTLRTTRHRYFLKCLSRLSILLSAVISSMCIMLVPKVLNVRSLLVHLRQVSDSVS